MTEDLIRMVDIRKSYGRVEALKGVDLTIRKGEIVGLLGDNGAGKSTIIKVLSGAVRLTSGEIYVRGTKVAMDSTAVAIANGIETIYQNSALVTQLSIARNLFLGREPVTGWWPFRRLDHATMDSVTRTLLREVGITKNIPPRTPISALSGGERQAVAIARAMHFDSDLIILDEPTNNLGVAETQGVLNFVRQARELGTFLHLHRAQHPSCVPGGGPDRGDASGNRCRRRHRSEDDIGRKGRGDHHRHGPLGRQG